MRFLRLCAVIMVLVMAASLPGCSSQFSSPRDVFHTDDDINMVSRANGEDISYYQNGSWHKIFWYGINLGATTPGHFPGELSPTYDDYRRWFSDMENLGIQVVRVYTILPPGFYQALMDHNKSARKKLWFIQGIWPPEDELAKDKNAYLQSITQLFEKEISLAVKAVYGQGEIAPLPGKASGDYQVNAAPYMLAWMVGGEWDPNVVMYTNKNNQHRNRFQGRYFKTTDLASPFEAWLAVALEHLAGEEMKMGWQHPVSFVNWVTTDPLSHPDEPLQIEDMASVDPMHITATDTWMAGYFAAYHVYPYYPDSLRYQKEYQEFTNSQGKKDPYEAYLVQLRNHHQGIPFIVAEFGVPSSRGMAHRAPLDRNQGMHTEYEQGQMIVSMFEAIQRARAQGGIVFEWQDEWFKFTWNTIDLEIPGNRRAMWHNRLTNEENFGLLAVEPGIRTPIILDGQMYDWQQINGLTLARLDDGSQLMATSDAAYLYLGIKRQQKWDWARDDLMIGFDTLPGGNRTVNNTNIYFANGAEFLLTFSDKEHASLQVASAYDQHSYIYGFKKEIIPWNPAWEQQDNGIFLPWKLCLSYPLFLPASQRSVAFEELDIGRLKEGNTNPDSSNYNSLADFYCGGDLLEIRIPWMMLGFTDPSSHQVWTYPYNYKMPQFTSTDSPGINICAAVLSPDSPNWITSQSPLFYNWSNWSQPDYHERKKQSYYLLKSFIEKSPSSR